jgi:hypothetical protein
MKMAPLSVLWVKCYIFLMEESSLMKLDLRAPLYYTPAADLPPVFDENEEFLLCFALDPVQSRSIEPERGCLLGSLLFCGRKTRYCASSSTNSGDSAAQRVTLPAGTYLFIQRRSVLNQEEWLDLAIEQQKDGLWARYKPENRLYIRHLFEDGGPVTQLLRPLKG